MMPILLYSEIATKNNCEIRIEALAMADKKGRKNRRRILKYMCHMRLEKKDFQINYSFKILKLGINENKDKYA